MMGSRTLVMVACMLGAIAVGVGAMGAHGLTDYLAKQGLDEALIVKRVQDCETAVRYQMFHALAILIIGLAPWASQNRVLRWSAWLMFLGVLLFSGGIYSIVFFQKLGHWAIVPSGGMLMIVGWCLAFLSALTRRGSTSVR